MPHGWVIAAIKNFFGAPTSLNMTGLNGKLPLRLRSYDSGVFCFCSACLGSGRLVDPKMLALKNADSGSSSQALSRFS
jgi:hypothetical protein